MAERTSYVPGTPSWVDLGSPDTTAAAAFYGALLGWTAAIDPRPEAGGYGMFTLRGKNVAGLGPQQNLEMPPFWAVYVTVSDADATLAKMTAAGATVIAGPMDVFDAGRMAVVADPVGSFISIWQPDQHIGAELVNEPGTFGWNELATPDLEASRAFYAAAFGWERMDLSSDGADLYGIDGAMVCGAHTAGEGEFPAWSVWFTVDDADASAAKVVELGGSVVHPPSDMSFGRGGVVADPHGAVFGIASLDEPAP
ncbi:MAG TPA: VOC family protein [Acidimicrobiales bacterium]